MVGEPVQLQGAAVVLRGVTRRVAARLSIAIAVGLGCPVMTSLSEAKVVAHPLSGASTDGTHVVFRETPYSVTVVNAATLGSARFDTPSCNGGDIAFSLVLLGCEAPRGFALMRADTGEITRRFLLGPDPESDVGPTDSFFVLGKFWALGRRDLGDRTPTIYLNLDTGHVSAVDGHRDLNDPGLARLPSGPCGGESMRVRYVLQFRNHLRRVALLDCKEHHKRLLARCRWQCQGTGFPLRGSVAVWASLDGGRIYARRLSGHRTCHWDVYSPATSPAAFYAAGRVFIESTVDLTRPSELRVERLTRC
jgi:hypothetical protein